jgi:hypothetical protein
MTSPTVPAMCFVVGNILKQIPQVPNWTIPVVLPFAGAILAVAMNAWNPNYAFTGFMEGASAVGFNELASRTIKATLTKETK